MTEDIQSDLIEGEGGKGGGGGAHTPTEAPNTLQATTFGVVMDILSEGPVKGLKNGANSVLLNDTPLDDGTGNLAFHGVTAVMRFGYPTQDPVVGFAYNDLSEPTFTANLGIEVKNGAPGPVTQSITDPNATSAIVTISVPQLVSVNTSTGDTSGSSVEIQIATRASATDPFVVVADNVIQGKTTTIYARQYRVVRPPGSGTWEIKVTRVTPDSTSSSLANTTIWSTLTVSYDNLMEYPNTAYVMMQFDASQFGNSMPTRKYELLGRLVSIPANYDPYARIYSGIWDGTFKTDWTNNPAWVWYDLITNNWFGAGEVIDPANVDKWALYSIAQFCDELVPDGKGGHEPRYTFNGVLDRPDDGLKVLQQIAAMFDSLVYASSTTVTVVQDVDSDSIKLINQANVINGEFSYQGTSLGTRPTAIRALFVDPDEHWKPSVEPTEYADLINQWGYQSQDIQLLGVTSRGQASRKGLNTIDLAWSSSEIVTFSGGLDIADVMPGDMILIQDPLYSGARYAGRIASGSTTTTVNLDGDVTLTSGRTYTLYVTNPDGTIEVRTFVQP
jgi:predicted phage tail protein